MKVSSFWLWISLVGALFLYSASAQESAPPAPKTPTETRNEERLVALGNAAFKAQRIKANNQFLAANPNTNESIRASLEEYNKEAARVIAQAKARFAITDAEIAEAKPKAKNPPQPHAMNDLANRASAQNRANNTPRAPGRTGD